MNSSQNNTRRRRRKVIWFNPPYSGNVKTNIGKIFFGIIKKHFPEGSELSRLFNKKILKISYSCMPNMTLISGSNKKGLSGHTDSFRNEKKEMATILSKHIWKLKMREVEHEVKWNIACLARPYARETKFCQLCNMEKTLIATENSANSLNRRWELMTRCRHRDKHLLTNWVTEYHHHPEVDLQEQPQDADAQPTPAIRTSPCY